MKLECRPESVREISRTESGAMVVQPINGDLRRKADRVGATQRN
jgi:hypothetical protein